MALIMQAPLIAECHQVRGGITDAASQNAPS
jgi:hypothetical protein